MHTSLRWQTAVRQADRNIYTRWQTPSSPGKSVTITGNFSIPPFDLFFIMPSASPFAGRRVRCAEITIPPTLLNRPFSVEKRLMLKRLLRQLQNHNQLLLPGATLLVFVCLSWTYRQQTPLLETPDEPSHFAVVNYIAQHGGLPPFSTETRSGPAPTVSPDVPNYYAPPLYYFLASRLVTQADTAEFAQAVIPNPNFARGLGLNLAAGPENKNMYVHTAVQWPSHQAEWAVAMWRVRLFSLVLGMATIAGSFALARQIWPQNWRWQLTAVSLIAFNPTFLYLSNGVTNDALLITLCTWSFVLLGSLLQSNNPKVRWREGALALLLGCAILTKQTGFILLPPALMVILARARQQQWTRQHLLTVLGIGAVIIAAVGGWWYLRNGFLYGDPLALNSHNALPLATDVLERLSFSVAQSWGAFKSYWAAFGWATIFIEPGWYLFFILLSTLGLTGWLGKRPFSSQNPSNQLTRILWLGVLLNGGLMFVWLWRTAAPYGRLLFPVIAPSACLLVLGWQQWLIRLRLDTALPKTIVQLGIVLPLLTLALLTPTRYLHPAFAPVAVPEAEAGSFLPLNATFGEHFELLGYTLEPETIQAGSELTLTLFWQLTQPSASQDSIITFIQVAPLNPEAQVAEASQLLGTPRYPAAFWQPDEIIVQQHSIAIAPDTSAPSLYWFDVILFDETTQARLPIVWQGQPLAEDLFRIGPEPVFIGDTAVPTPTHLTNYNFDQQIELDGYTISPSANNGLEVTLLWQALAHPTADWTVFVQLIDERGELVSQGDGVPRNGEFPTSWWAAGTAVPDTHWLPGNITCAELNKYTLLLGFYNPATAERLSVSDGTGQPLPSGVVEIQPTCSEGNS